MSELEKCLWIRREILARAGEAISYTHWSDEFAAKRLKKFPAETGITVQLGQLTGDEMDELGLERAEGIPEARLIPLWIWEFLDEEIKDGKGENRRTRRKSEMDSDNRCGQTAHTIFPAKPAKPTKP